MWPILDTSRVHFWPLLNRPLLATSYNNKDLQRRHSDTARQGARGLSRKIGGVKKIGEIETSIKWTGWTLFLSIRLPIHLLRLRILQLFQNLPHGLYRVCFQNAHVVNELAHVQFPFPCFDFCHQRLRPAQLLGELFLSPSPLSTRIL